MEKKTKIVEKIIVGKKIKIVEKQNQNSGNQNSGKRNNLVEKKNKIVAKKKHGHIKYRQTVVQLRTINWRKVLSRTLHILVRVLSSGIILSVNRPEM